MSIKACSSYVFDFNLSNTKNSEATWNISSSSNIEVNRIFLWCQRATRKESWMKINSASFVQVREFARCRPSNGLKASDSSICCCCCSCMNALISAFGVDEMFRSTAMIIYQMHGIHAISNSKRKITHHRTRHTNRCGAASAFFWCTLIHVENENKHIYFQLIHTSLCARATLLVYALRFVATLQP